MAQWKVNVDPEKQIRKLTNALTNKSMRIAMNAASAPVKAAVVSQVPHKYGYLAQAQRIRLRQYKSSQVWVSIIGASRSYVRVKGKRTRGPNKGQGIKHRPANYAHLVEGGTKYFAGKHFMKAAKQQTQHRFAEILCQRLRMEIDNALK
jgi:HK97 gp10 family phage protein